MRALLLTASLAATAAVLASAAPGNSSLAKGFILASPGATCASTCEAAGKSVAKFAEFNAGASPAQTAVCAIKSNDKEGWVPGWQPVGSAAPADCNVALNLNATAATRDVACLCLEGGEVQGLDLPARPLVYEGFIDFRAEFSVLLCRGADGDIRFWDTPENVHDGGILARSTVPGSALVQGEVAEARALAAQVAAALDYVGVLTLEFFATAAGPVFNEMAPRVHNSGHWTIEGAITSQFENHIRAICGLPLGDTGLAARGVVMDNLIGDAAHGVHPIAGQGLNLGFRDVAALAEEVIAAWQAGEDPGAPTVLARYQARRRPDTLLMLAGMHGLERLFGNDIGPIRWARRLGIAAVDRLPGLKRAFARQAMGMGPGITGLLAGQPLPRPGG